MNAESSLNLIAAAIGRTDPDIARFFSIVWRGRFLVIPHDGLTNNYPNKIAIITAYEIRNGLTNHKWSKIKARLVKYRKENGVWSAPPKP